MGILTSFFSAILFLVRAAVFIYLSASSCIFLISLWLKHKMAQNPRRDIYHFGECPWYQHPRSLFDRIAKRLITPGFISICDSAAVTATAILTCVGFLFALIAIS